MTESIAPEDFHRLQEHSERLFDLAISAWHRFKIVQPLLFDEDTINRLSNGRRRPGFQTLRHTLYWDLIKEIAKLTFDRDDRCPSIRTIVKTLQKPGVRERLYTIYTVPMKSGQIVGDPLSQEFLQGIEDEERRRLETEFDAIFDRVISGARQLFAAPQLLAYHRIRNKNIAHSEVEFVNGRYQFVEIKNLGIKYGDERAVLNAATEIVDDIFSIVKRTSFDWENSMEMFEEDALHLWSFS